MQTRTVQERRCSSVAGDRSALPVLAAVQGLGDKMDQVSSRMDQQQVELSSRMDQQRVELSSKMDLQRAELSSSFDKLSSRMNQQHES